MKRFREILRELDIADEEQLDLFDTLDVDGNGTLDFEELVGGIAKLRGDARRSDVISVSLMARAMQTDLTDFEARVQKQLKQQEELLRHVATETSRSPCQSPRRRTMSRPTSPR